MGIHFNWRKRSKGEGNPDAHAGSSPVRPSAAPLPADPAVASLSSRAAHADSLAEKFAARKAEREARLAKAASRRADAGDGAAKRGAASGALPETPADATASVVTSSVATSSAAPATEPAKRGLSRWFARGGAKAGAKEASRDAAKGDVAVKRSEQKGVAKEMKANAAEAVAGASDDGSAGRSVPSVAAPAKAQRDSRLRKRKPVKARRKRRSTMEEKRVLAQLVQKAGHTWNPDALRRVVFRTTLTLIGLFTVITLVIAAVFQKSAGGLLVFYLGVWTAVFAFVYLFVWMVIYLYLDMRIYNRTRELEEVLPDFLQLASANISAGMPIDRALWFAVRPNFGVLAKEIEEVAKATLAGEELNKSLLAFTERYDSLILRRSINILLEGIAAGGEIAGLLNKISQDIQETKILRKEMSANVATYAIFITFASIVMAPILFALATQLLVIIVKITSSLDLSASSSTFLTLNVKTSPKMVSDFRLFSIMMLSVSALMSASIVSVIRKGNVKEGARNLPIFLVVSLSLYFLISYAFSILLGSLI